ncbi:MAG: type VI immunity family protein [Myxococcota bacterium]
MILPPQLQTPIHAEDGSILRSLFGDLTIYLERLTEDQLNAVVAWYESVCPPGRMTQYTLEELSDWDEVSTPAALTKHGREARARGERLPFLAPVRRRIAEGRRFYVQFWDGEVVDPWSLTLRAPHYEDLGLRPFVRLLVPVGSVEWLPEFAGDLAGMLDFHSGHAGLAFGYNPWWLEDAFDGIYAKARRFWGVDVEHLNGTMRAIKPGIKGISWLTLLGRDLVSEELLAALQASRDRQVTQRGGGVLIRLGDEPDIGDQNRPSPAMNKYFDLAALLDPLFVAQHLDFPGAFEDQGNTMEWIRRFIEPDGWR